MSSFANLDNRTPFVAEQFVVPDGFGGELVLVVVKSTFAIDRSGEPSPAPEQAPIRLVDEWPLGESDLVPHRPFVDVLVVEPRAWAPRGRAVESLLVGLRVGALTKVVQVTGDRTWRGQAPSRPEPFALLPIPWERSFGGASESGELELRNLVGSRLPNLEYPRETIQRLGQVVTPAGLGVVARNVQPRAARVGTCDEAWLRERWPLLPHDFDPTYHQAAPDDQWLPRLDGGESIVAENLSAEGSWRARVPSLDAPIRLFYEDRSETAQLRTDMLELLPERSELVLTSRLAIPVVRNRGRLLEILVGHAPPGWIRARIERKRYVDLRKLGGRSS